MKIELEFKSREDFRNNIDSVPPHTQVLMISHMGGYMLGKVVKDKNTKHNFVSNDYYAQYYAIIPNSNIIL